MKYTFFFTPMFLMLICIPQSRGHQHVAPGGPHCLPQVPVGCVIKVKLVNKRVAEKLYCYCAFQISYTHNDI